MESLSEIFARHNTDKGPSMHNYTRQYDPLLRPWRNEPVRILEIGVQRGGSLRAMREAFANAQTVVGIDINPTCKSQANAKKDVHVEIGNATDSCFLQDVVNKHGPFDIILDDGSHKNNDIITTFELLLPHLKNEGIYIVEDTLCYKFPQYVDDSKPHHLAYFWELTTYLNQSCYDSTRGKRNHSFCTDPFKIQKTARNLSEASIDKIEFGCGFIAIHKQTRTHWL